MEELVKLTMGNYDHNDDDVISLAEVTVTDQAFPTGRLLVGVEEWQEPVRLPDGRRGLLTYLFNEDDMRDENGEPLDAEDYPWDYEHITRIVLIVE